MSTVRTTDLTPGQRVIVRGSGGLVRTVEQVVPSGHTAAKGVGLLTVWWAESRTPEWSSGNSALPTDEWELA